MSLAKFYYGSTSDLQQKSYEEGAVYFAFAESSPTTLGHIYLDVSGDRREISSAYNDSELIMRLAELERVTLVHCTGLSIESSKQIAKDGAVTVIANITPFNTTDEIIWESSDSNVATIGETSFDMTTGEATATILPNTAGTTSIIISCGQYNGVCNIEVLDTSWFISYILASEYSPNGSSFFYTAPIILYNSQYIEAKIDLSGVNAIKQNLLSIGENIDTFTETKTPKIHIYSSQTPANKTTHLRFAFIYTSNKTGIEYVIPNRNSSVVTIRLDYDGLWINDTAFVCPDNTGQAIYESIMNVFRQKTSFDVGSQEGANRSTAYYEYIKYVKYEPTV